MKTYFYKNTAYRFLPIEIPECFLKLDEYFDGYISDSSETSIARILKFPLVNLAENLCYRMADIDLYAFLIDDLLQDNHEFWSKESPTSRHIHKKAILSSSLLIPYFSSCKSLFDAGAIALNQIYSFGLKEKEQDFRKGRLPKLLRDKSQSDYTEYVSLVYKIIKWRDDCIHRKPPAVMPVDKRVIPNSSGKGFSFSLFGKMQKGSTMLDEPIILDEVIKAIEINDAQKKNELGFCELLDPHNEWRKEFIGFCGLVCDEIKKADFLKGYITDIS